MGVKILLHYSLAYPVSDDPNNPEGPLDGSYSILMCTCTQFSDCKNIYISRRRVSLSLAIFSVMRNGNLNKFSHLKHALLCIVWTFLSNLPSNPDRVRSPQVWISEIVLYNKSILKRKELKKI